MKPQSKLLKTEVCIEIERETLYSYMEENEVKYILYALLQTVQDKLEKMSKENSIYAEMLGLNPNWAEDWQEENLAKKFMRAVTLQALNIAIEKSLTSGGELKLLMLQAMKKVNLDEILYKLSIEFGEKSLDLSKAGKLGMLNAMQMGNK